MLSKKAFVLIAILFVFGVESSHRKPLIDADEIPAMRPVCRSDLNGMKKIPCPKPDKDDQSNWPCIRYVDLCNDRPDCPNGEDENPNMCFYHAIRREQIKNLNHKLESLSG